MRCVALRVVLGVVPAVVPAAVVLLGGCGFQSQDRPVGDTLAPAVDAPPAPPDAIAIADAGPADAPASDAPTIDAPSPSPPPIDAASSTFCDARDSHVIACYELDGNALDGSSHHLDATTTHVAFQAGVVGDALQLAADSAVDAPDRPALDVDAVTIEAWVFASQLPADPSSAFILDVDQQYAMFARRGGDFGCSFVGGPDVTAIGRVPARAWHHVACTYDGNTSVIYVDGEQANSAKGGNALGKAGKTGLSLGGSNPSGTGGRFIGLIDEVRLTDEARTAQQICTDAGEFSCL